MLEDEEAETLEGTLTAQVPLVPELAASCLCSVIGDCDGSDPPPEVQLPLVTSLPMHRMHSASDLLATASSFSILSTPKLIRLACKEHVAGWESVPAEDINVDQIMAGLSNQLFKVNIREGYPDRSRFLHTDVLFRIYGKDVNSLYDSATELCVFKKLGLRGVAPRLIAEVEGGRVEEWIDGAALLCEDMQRISVLHGVAAILSGIHKIDLSKYVDTKPCVFKFLERWRKGAMKNFSAVGEDHPSYLALQRMNLPLFAEESYRIEEYLFPRGCSASEATIIAFCHNDIQENNIMVTHSSMRLIDFEYSGYNFPAYDIASFFWEMTCNYCVTSYPFFSIDPAKYPPLHTRRLFAAMYLSFLTGTTVKTSHHDRLDPFLDAVERFQLATHMLWAFWSVIRAPQAATATQFDMLLYGQKRIDCYWAQKAYLLANGKLSDEKRQ